MLTPKLLLTSLAVLALGQETLEDFTKADVEKLGIKAVPEKKDPKTGFVVGGKNPTDLIRKLTEIAGRSIADLEKDMRPRALSWAGFLGKEERLLDILTADNRLVVEELGLTHQELARHLHVLGKIAARDASQKEKELLYHGRRYKVKAMLARGFQDSPFDDGTKTNCNATVWNLDNGKKLTYSLLVPDMIERYGFYEGEGTPYRVEPRAVLEVFDFLKSAKKP
jgi:hypothetical protein